MIAETKLAKEDQPKIVAEKSPEAECRKFYVLSANIEIFTDILEVVRDTRCLLCMEKRENHERRNAERESERLLREPWQDKPGWKHTRTESLRQSESKRGKELE